MDEHGVEIFIHALGKPPDVIEVYPHDILRDVLARVGVVEGGEEEIFVFVGECEDALHEPEDVEDGEDGHEPAQVVLTVEVLDLHRHRHVHCHKCRRIATEVHFGERTIHRRFSPAATVGTVAQWARRKFHVDAAIADEYVLQLVGTVEQPRPDVHIGELVTAHKCSLGFDLVKEVTPQG
jgi:hypothetical protein